jgi:hypothetical protein
MAQQSHTTTDDEEWYVKPDTFGRDDAVKRVYESMQGDLWFVTDTNAGYGYARLYAMPQFAEWGYLNVDELERNPKVWPVKRQNWVNITSYEDGLLTR